MTNLLVVGVGERTGVEGGCVEGGGSSVGSVDGGDVGMGDGPARTAVLEACFWLESSECAKEKIEPLPCRVKMPRARLARMRTPRQAASQVSFPACFLEDRVLEAATLLA